MNKTALISGASIAGLTMAYWVNRSGYKFTVEESAAGLKPIIMKVIILFLVCLLTTLLQAQTKIDISKEKQKLQTTLDDWALRAASGNLDSTMLYWANDAIILDHGRLINGKDDIKKMMSGINKISGSKMTWDNKPSKLEVSISGDMAYMILGNKLSMPDSTGKIISIRNTALETWKKDTEGIWKCAIVMMMTNETQ